MKTSTGYIQCLLRKGYFSEHKWTTVKLIASSQDKFDKINYLNAKETQFHKFVQLVVNTFFP